MATVRTATVPAPTAGLSNPTYLASGTTGANQLITLLADRTTLVACKSGASRQIGVSVDGAATWTWGKSFESTGWFVDALVETAGGEVLVGIRDTTNAAAGVIYRSTGWNKATADATTWTKVLTGSGPNVIFDTRWGLTRRSLAPSWSARPGVLFVAEYGKHLDLAASPDQGAVRVMMSVDDGVTWTKIFDLRDRYPGLTARLHVHAVAYDPYDDRVYVASGDGGNADGAGCALWYCNGEDLASPAWTAVPGMSSTLATRQVTTVIPVESGIVLLADGAPYGVQRLARRGYRRLAPVVEVAPVGGGVIGGGAWRNPDQPGAPLLLSHVSSTASGPPSLLATLDGETFTEIHREGTAVTNSAPGLTTPLGPDINGKVYATRNLAGTADILTADYAPPRPPADGDALAGKAARSAVDIFLTSGTWTKRPGATSVHVTCIGAGAGGGSGRVSASGTLATGGAGGSGGGYTDVVIPVDVLGATETVTVGTGGTGGAAVLTDSTNGNQGTSGGASSFGTRARASGGNPGSGGLSSGAAAGNSGGSGTTIGQTGASSSGSGGAGSGPSVATYVAGGGSGGGIATTPAAVAGGAGGSSTATGSAGPVGGSAGSAGNNGSSNTGAATPGSGGSGGGSAITGAAGAGGNGGTYGTGGGGGAAALNGQGGSGKGGDGAAGIVVVVTYF